MVIPPLPWSVTEMTTVLPSFFAKSSATFTASSNASVSEITPMGSFACAAQSTLLPSTKRKKPFSFLLKVLIAFDVISAKEGSFEGSRSKSYAISTGANIPHIFSLSLLFISSMEVT